MKKLVIFDLDGTLLNSIADLGAATNHALRKHGLQEHDLDEYRYFVGNGVNKLIERALPEEMRDTAHVMMIKEDFMPYYMAHKSDLTRPYDGITELLSELQDKGVRMAVASNKFIEGTRELVKNFFSQIKFDMVLGQREGIPIKPDPAIANEIVSGLGVDKSDVLYVGDTSIDMNTARNARLTAVGVAWGFRSVEELKESGADYIIKHPQELIGLL